MAGAFAPVFAHAHFILVTPDSWMSQNSLGYPQKLGPCGDEGGGTPTGNVTAFGPGDTISVTINEVITHPGHYRVALAVNDRSELPPAPTVTPKPGDPCGSAAIQDPPTFPILADNVLPHTQPFAGPQTFTVTLPTDVTCTKCTLQVLEFMSSHPVPCFYYHCADISIQEESVCRLDVDGNGVAEAGTDVVYVLRHLLGLTPVPPAFRDLDPAIPDDPTVAARVEATRAALDVDADGQLEVATDLVYVARYLLGLTPVPPSFRDLDQTIPPDAVIGAAIGACLGGLSPR